MILNYPCPPELMSPSANTTATTATTTTPPNADEVAKMRAALTAAIGESIIVEHITNLMKKADMAPEKGCLCFVPKAWDKVLKSPPAYIRFSPLISRPFMLDAKQAGLLMEPGNAFRLPEPSRIITPEPARIIL